MIKLSLLREAVGNGIDTVDSCMLFGASAVEL